MKKTLCILLALALCLFGAAVAETTAIANPWVDATAGDIAEAIGAAFGIPEGAENVEYSLLPDEGLAEMRFTLDDMTYVARIQPAEEFTDISGMYYEWEADAPFSVAGFEGLDQRATDGEETVELCQWFDAPSGLVYSLSVYTTDPDGLDLTAVAEQVNLSVLGDV